jgi:hypothetical protein
MDDDTFDDEEEGLDINNAALMVTSHDDGPRRPDPSNMTKSQYEIALKEYQREHKK